MKIKIFLFIFLNIFFLSTAFAKQGIKDFSNFKSIPVLDAGRIKPLDIFARSLLTQFSGHDHYGKQEAVSFLASLSFNPGSTLNDKIIMFYIFAFILFLGSFSSPKAIWYRLGLSSVIAGLILHALGLGLRTVIMARSPVTSLYETFIFVGLVCVFLGLLIEYYNRQWLGIITAAISGIGLLFIANKYSSEGDTLKVLVAVLNSNFWLATHVTTITMGYGAALVAGLLGHIWLIQAVFLARTVRPWIKLIKQPLAF